MWNRPRTSFPRFSLMVFEMTRGDAACALQKQKLDGARWSGLQVTETQPFDEQTMLVHVTYTLTVKEQPEARDELWPMRLENGAWRYNWNNLIDFRTLEAPAQTTNGVTIMPVQINRFSDRIQLVLLVQNRTEDAVVFGQVNEILGTFHFGDQAVVAEKTQIDPQPAALGARRQAGGQGALRAVIPRRSRSASGRRITSSRGTCFNCSRVRRTSLHPLRISRSLRSSRGDFIPPVNRIHIGSKPKMNNFRLIFRCSSDIVMRRTRMKSSKQTPSARKPALWPLWVTVALVLLAGSGAAWYFLWGPGSARAQSGATAGAELYTSAVKRGDLRISASGSGKLVAYQSVDLSFSTSGTVSELNVTAGDMVKAGQVLASLGSSPTLEANLAAAKLQVLQAQKTLTDLQQNADLSLAQAYSDLVAAQQTYDAAFKEKPAAWLMRAAGRTTATRLTAALEQATQQLAQHSRRNSRIGCVYRREEGLRYRAGELQRLRFLYHRREKQRPVRRWKWPKRPCKRRRIVMTRSRLLQGSIPTSWRWMRPI